MYKVETINHRNHRNHPVKHIVNISTMCICCNNRSIVSQLCPIIVDFGHFSLNGVMI